MRKPVILIALFFALFGAAKAQQDALYSMYMFNGMTINPAYAGSRERPAVTAIYRHQWTGMEGAPKTAVLSAHMPLSNEHIGLGLTLASDNISIFKTNSITANYAYRAKFKKNRGTLSFGVNVTLNYFHSNWSDLILKNTNDDSFTGKSESAFSPNFGAGIYYYSERFYAGISVPHFLNMSLTDNFKLEGKEMVARQYKHYYFTSGVVINVSHNVKFKPSFLLKYVNNTPIQADINAAVLFNESLWLGASYRTGDAVVLMAEYNFAKGVRIGYSYDLSTSAITQYTQGSHEIMIGYEFIKKGPYVTPRRMSYF